MIQMAYGYMRKYGTGDKKFIPECIRLAQDNYGDRPLLSSYFLTSLFYVVELDDLLYKKGVKDLKEIEKMPEAKALRNAYLKTETFLSRLGYQDVPPALYESIISSMEKKGTRQKQTNYDTKQKRSLFIYSTQ